MAYRGPPPFGEFSDWVQGARPRFPRPPPPGHGRGNGPRPPWPPDWHRPPLAGPGLRHAGPRLPPHATGNRPVMRDQPQWDQIQKDAEHWKIKGNHAIKEEQYAPALSCYQVAVTIAMSIPANEWQIAAIQSNQSFAYLKLGHSQEALQMGRDCVDMNPKWHKGYFRVAQAFEALQVYDIALESLASALRICPMKPEQELEIVRDAVSLALKTTGGSEEIRKCRVKRSTWTELITAAVKKDDWKTVKFLILGDKASSPTPVDCDLSAVKQLTPFIKNSTDKDLSDWGQKLILFMLKRGAPYKSLEEPERSALHVALDIGIRTGCFELLDRLLQDDYTSPHERNTPDCHGNTLLHGAAMAEVDLKVRLAAIHLLLSRSLATRAQNKIGKFPADYLRKNDPSYRLLRPADSPEHKWMKELKEKGNRFLKQNKNARALEQYTEALKVIPQDANLRKQLQITSREVAQLHSNRATVLLKMNRLEEALKSAEDCLRMDGNWFKGHVRLGKVSEKLGKHGDALHSYKRAFVCIMSASVTDDQIQVEILTDMTLLSRFAADTKKCLSDCKAPPDVWKQVIVRVLRKSDYRSLLMLVTSKFTKRCNLESLNYSAVLSTCVKAAEIYSSASDIEKLIMGILDRRGSLSFLVDEDSPLHTGMLIAMHTGSGQLFEYLLTQRMVRSTEINRKDSRGNTLLHVLIKSNLIDTFRGQMICTKLLDYGANVNLTDLDGHTADEYLQGGHPALLQIVSMRNAVFAPRPEVNMKKPQQTQTARPQQVKKSKKPDSEPATESDQSSATLISSFSAVCQQEMDIAQSHRQKGKACEALSALCRILRMRPGSTLEEYKRFSEKACSDVCDIIVNSASDLPTKELQLVGVEVSDVVRDLAVRECWQRLRDVLTALKDRVSEFPQLAKLVDVAGLINGCYNRGNNRRRRELLNLLLDFGAPPGGTSDSAVKVSFENCDSSLLSCLLASGASLQNIKWSLHRALNVALQTGNFDLLTLLLDQPGMNLSVKRPNGNTLFHEAASAPFSKHALRAIELLSGTSCNPNLRNNSGKTALECLTEKGRKTDRRAQFIKMAANKFPSSMRKPKKKSPPPRGHGTTDIVDVTVNCTGTESEFVGTPSSSDDWEKGETRMMMTINPREVCRRHIADMIEGLSDPGCLEQRPTTPELQEDSDSHHDETSDHGAEEERDDGDGCDVKSYDTTTNDDAMTEVTDTTAVQTSVDDDIDDNDDDDDTDIDPSIFDDLVWEVECTANVWKLLKDKQVPEFMKRRSITKIKRLANGDWTRTLAKKLDHVPPDIHLYEAKLSKGARIVWELAVAFSPRRSEDADRRLGANASESGVKGGRIYAEVIRVWDIVLRHDNLLRTIDRIIRSHNRGSDCILQKRLRGIVRQKFHTSSGVVHQRVPILYVEIDDDGESQNPQMKDADLAPAAQRYFPPASPNETEYHIMKFYAFTSTLVTNILADQGTKVDFPFRVTELEHAIIHLQPRPPTAILLLGRSGTGKTTCCVYRLWSAFIRYWEKATAADAPLMPRKVFYKDTSKDECDEEKDVAETPDETNNEAMCANAERGVDSRCATETFGWDHLRQVFVTKNPVLCSEVQKNFCDLSHASDTARHHTAVEQDDLPSRLQDVRPDVFPLFLTMRCFLLMLDGSMPDAYFERESDGSLTREVTGWGDNNNQLSFIPDVTFDDDTDDVMPLDVATDDVQTQKQHRKKCDPRREVTYEVFVHELWPKMNKKLQLDCHSSLVWMEIRSFIQGSFEALMGETGYLSLGEYLQLGKKRAENFNSDRSAVYELYKEYRRLKQNLAMYDENDLVYHIYHRLTFNGAAPEWIVHEFYVDETQDFTQAELCLLIRCVADPNATFFTGDTAQSIMRGIAFRFEDLRSLFFYAQQSFRCQDQASTIEVPRLYQLTHNYRSHAGILALAASIVDLLIKFFPNSFDRLEKDCGLFEGPKPVLLESCSVSDLALLLRGSQRQTSQIEFGAHQAILVANDQVREHIPEELSLGLVLTIFEAKGLEFDDILLYNFFKDSQASQEWRVVTEHLNTLLEQQHVGRATSSQSAVIEIDRSVVDSDDRPRPLAFDPDQHKVLNSELKYLYTALTRARVNVWIFDEDSNARAPMFEYFRACHLVEVVAKEGTDVTEQELPDRVFAEASTCSQWRHRGDEFYKHHLYNVAAKCYVRSGDLDKEKMSRAQQRALEASRLCYNPRKLRHEFLFAAEEYLNCGMTMEAAKCLCNAKETLLAAQLYEKMGQSHHAAALYKKLGRMDDASRAYENDNKFGQAVELLVAAKYFDKAIDVVSRYHIKVQEYEKQGKPVPTKMLANRPGSKTRSVKQLCLEAAEFHHQSGHTDNMLGSLDRLPDVSDKIQFLLQRDYVKLAAPIMQENGRASEAAEAFYKAGELEMALQYVSAETQLPFRADCLLSASRHIMSHETPSDDERNNAEKYLLEALNLFVIIGDDHNHSGAEANLLLGRSAETKLLLGRLKNDSTIVSEAYETFHKLHNDIGQIMCTKMLLDQNALQDKDECCSKCLRCLQMLFDLARALEFAEKALEKDQTRHVRNYYGLQDTDKRHKFRIMRGQGAHINACMPAKIRSTIGNLLEEKDAHEYIISDLVRMVPSIVAAIRIRAMDVISKNRPCERYSAGLECEVCCRPHFVATREQCKQQAQALLWMVQLDVLISTILKRRFMDKVNSRDSKMLRDLETKPRGKWLCKFYQAMFPDDGRVSDGTVELMRSIRGNTRLRDRIMRCTEEWLWKPVDREDRQANTDRLVMLHNIRLMCQPNLESLHSLLLPEEKWFKEHLHKARSPPDLGIHRSTGLIYFRKYIEGAVQLYHKHDPVQAFACLNMLLYFIAVRPRDPLLPSIANAAMLLEQQIMLALCLNLHSKGGASTVLLPECYLAAINFRDGLHSQKSNGGFYSIIHQHASQRLAVGRVLSLARVMCGHRNKDFDLFDYVFRSGQAISSGECERVLILALVMLSNAGVNRPIPLEAENMLRDRLAAASFSAALNVPSRLATALAEAKAASCKRDVVVALKRLLEKRHPKEPLRKCVWSRTWGGLTVIQVPDVCAIDDDRRYKPCTHVISQPHGEMRLDVLTAQEMEDRPRDGETEENWEEEFFTDECIEQAQTDQELLDTEISTPHIPEGASSHAPPPELQHQMSTADPFDEYVIDDTMCQVCYVLFTPSAEPASPGGEMLHPKELHEMSHEHQLKQNQFEIYKNWFMGVVFPLLQRASGFLTTFARVAQPVPALLGLQHALHQLYTSRKDVEDQRQWDRLQAMDEAANNLRGHIIETQNTLDCMLEEEKQRMRQEADTQAALGEDQGVLQADDDQYKDDEAGPILKVVDEPKTRKTKPRRQNRNNAKSSGRRN